MGVEIPVTLSAREGGESLPNYELGLFWIYHGETFGFRNPAEISVSAYEIFTEATGAEIESGGKVERIERPQTAVGRMLLNELSRRSVDVVRQADDL